MTEDDSPQPTGLDRVGDSGIVIHWSDGESTQWSVSKLRNACPCATCREKKRGDDDASQESGGKSAMLGLPVLSAAEARPLRIESMKPVGTYAYNIAFSDGHNSGIFTFELLRGDVNRNGS